MTPPIVLDPLLSPDEAAVVVDVWHGFSSYGLYSNEGFATDFAPELAQRYDATVNFIRTGGRFGRTGEDASMLAARTNYFRETYAYGDDMPARGIERFYHHPRLLDGARALHGRDVIAVRCRVEVRIARNEKDRVGRGLGRDQQIAAVGCRL